ncbi:MAG: hypothetical protein AAF682_27570 [Planctomycetota bacterium]
MPRATWILAAALGVAAALIVFLAARGPRGARGEGEHALPAATEPAAPPAAAADRLAEAPPRTRGEAERVAAESVTEALAKERAASDAERAAREGWIQLRARIVDEAGEPVRNTALRSRLYEGTAAEPRSNSAWTQTDGEGRLTGRVEGGWVPGELRLFELVDVTSTPTRGARLDLAYELPAGEVDLGDVVLVLPPLIAAGVVRNPGGLAVPEATVVVELPRIGGGRTMWTPMEDGFLETGADGRFEARAWIEPVETVRLNVMHRAASRPDPVHVPLGSAGVELVVAGAASLVAQVLFDEGRAPVNLRLVARPVPSGPAWGGEVARNGAARVDRLQVGTYRAELKLVGAPELLSVTDPIEIGPGERAEPPALNPFDLRGRLHWLSVDVRDAGGRPLRGARILTRPEGTEAGWSRQPETRRHPVELALPEALTDLRVEASGHRALELYGVSGAVEVTLVAGYPIELVLVEPTELPSGCHLTVELSPDEGGARARKVELRPDRSAEVLASVAGPHTARVTLMWTGRSNGRFGVPVDERPTVVVGETGATQHVELRFGAEALANAEEALAALRGTDE